MAGIHTWALTLSQAQLSIVCVRLRVRYDTVNKPMMLSVWRNGEINGKRWEMRERSEGNV